MKLKTILAASAIAVASTTVVADVETPDGELVVIEKNQGVDSAALLSQLGPVLFAVVIAAVAASSGS